MDWKADLNFGRDVVRPETRSQIPLPPLSSWVGIIFHWRCGVLGLPKWISYQKDFHSFKTAARSKLGEIREGLNQRRSHGIGIGAGVFKDYSQKSSVHNEQVQMIQIID